MCIGVYNSFLKMSLALIYLIKILSTILYIGWYLWQVSRLSIYRLYSPNLMAHINILAIFFLICILTIAATLGVFYMTGLHLSFFRNGC